jgi:hypothetical protein
MNRKYIEIDSTYRNRKQFPNPSTFTVLFGQSGTRNAINAYDPISLATPLKTWIPNDLILAGGNIPISSLNDRSNFNICFPSGTAQTLAGYYNGYPIQVNVPAGETVKILSWFLLSTNPLGDDCFTVSVTPSFSVIPSGAVTFLPNSTNLTNGIFYIPDGFEATNYYVGYIIYNQTLNQWRPIISYNALLKQLGLDLSTEYGGPIVPAGWTNAHTYSVRQSLPQYVGTLPGGVVPFPFNPSISFFVPSNIIVSIGDFIRFTSGPYNNTSCRVTGYVGSTTNIITVDCVLNPIPVIGTTFEVLQFTRDNAVPFCYSGSSVSQQEMVCYEIRLVNLVLPNRLLVAGGRIAFYPYVYVEFQNVSSSSAGTKCVMYSNNPHSQKILFRAAIDDIRDPVIAPFIKIDGDGMVQTVKFKPNDNFKFGVYFPNGNPLETIEHDCLSPNSPDPLLQVSATFEIKRL